MGKGKATTDYAAARRDILAMVAASTVSAAEAQEMLAQVTATQALDKQTAREEGKRAGSDYNAADDKTCGDVIEYNGQYISIGSYRGGRPTLRVKVGQGTYVRSIKPSLDIIDHLRALDDDQYNRLLGSARTVDELYQRNQSAGAKNRASETPAQSVPVPADDRVDILASNVANVRADVNELKAGMSEILAALRDTAKTPSA